MSFVIRQIAKRADGSDIIRKRIFDAAEITVGRGTDCDIQLPDLGVMLRHARLSQLSDGTVAIEATGGIPLEIGGKFVNRADLDVSDNPTIDIASHRLTLSVGDTPGAIAITAERVIAASDSADAAAEMGIFSLRETMPSKRTMSWVLATFILLAFLAVPVWMMLGRDAQLPTDMVVAAARQDGSAQGSKLSPTIARQAAAKGGFTPDMVWSSGPLSSAHAGLSNKCGACHSKPFVSVTDGACITCHKAVSTPEHAAPSRMEKGRLVSTGIIASLHKGLNLPEGRCASCHKEHEGPRGALMVSQDFCTDCHTGLSSRLTDTKIANVPNWDQHPQFKATIVSAPSLTAPRFERVSLSSKPQEQSGLVYPHDLHLSKTNSVANMMKEQGLPGANGALACNYCHTPDSDGVRFKPIEMEKNCGDCHDLAFARDGGVVRTLPHGKPEQVAGIVRDFYLSQALSPRAGVQRLDFERRQPGRMAELEAADLRISGAGQARARADTAIAGIFGKGGVCSDCHGVINTGAPNAAQRFAIVPVTLADHYLPKGMFPHSQHQTYDGKTGDAACIACHQGVTTSKVSADVLLPPVSQCRDCHGSNKAATNVAATCDTCHGFHYGEGGQGGDIGTPHRKLPVKPATVAARAVPMKFGGAIETNASPRRVGP
jgi:predicted CXXCH cytochrome family protein